MYNAYPGAGAMRGDNGVPDYDDRRRETTAFEAIALYRTQGATIGGDGGADAERVTSMPVTPSFFRILRATPFRGRLFTDDDGEIGQHEKAVLSYGLWQRLFAGQDSAIGQTRRLGGVLHTVVGVMPAGLPLREPRGAVVDAGGVHAGRARRRPAPQQQLADAGAARARRDDQEAQRQIDALNARNLERFPAVQRSAHQRRLPHARRSASTTTWWPSTRATLWLLWAFAGFVLLIGALERRQPRLGAGHGAGARAGHAAGARRDARGR